MNQKNTGFLGSEIILHDIVMVEIRLYAFIKIYRLETSLVVQWLRLRLPVQGVKVRSLVREIRSHMPQEQKNQNIKQKRYCNKFNKDFKNGPHQKIFLKNLGTSLVVQWLRICLPMQGTRVQSLVREDPTCRRATKHVRHNY